MDENSAKFFQISTVLALCIRKDYSNICVRLERFKKGSQIKLFQHNRGNCKINNGEKRIYKPITTSSDAEKLFQFEEEILT